MKYIIIILLLVLITLLSAGYYTFMTVFDSEYKKKGHDPDYYDSEKDKLRPTSRRLQEMRKNLSARFNSLPFEEVTVTSFDGLKLYGSLLKGNPEEVVICIHGYRSSSASDFCDRLEIYLKRGSTILFVDNRAHGRSAGRYIGFSELDKHDVGKWVELINKMYERPRIYLHGVSMGAATAVHCADMKYENVCGIIEDCGFDTILDLSKVLCQEVYHLPFFPVGYISWGWSMLLAKISYNASIGEECVRKTDIPMLFIHGKEDHYIPYQMTVKMYEACASEKELLLVEGAGHGAAYMLEPEKYTEAVNRLLDKKI